MLNYLSNPIGGVAQLVRVPASHAGGPGFEPQRVHHKEKEHPRGVLSLYLGQVGLDRTRERKLRSAARQST